MVGFDKIGSPDGGVWSTHREIAERFAQNPSLSRLPFHGTEIELSDKRCYNLRDMIATLTSRGNPSVPQKQKLIRGYIPRDEGIDKRILAETLCLVFECPVEIIIVDRQVSQGDFGGKH